MRHQTLFFVILSLCVNSIFGEPLSLSRALSLANGNTDDMEIIREKQKAGHYEVQSVKSAVYPNVSFSSNATQVSTSSKSFGPMASGFTGLPDRFNGQEYGWSLQLNQPLITFGRLGVLIKIAKKTLTSIDLQYDLEKEQYYLKVIETYTQAVSSQMLFDASTKTLKYLNQLEQFMEIEHQGGAKSNVDLMRSKSRLQMARSDSVRYSMEKESAITRLKSLLNIPAEQSIEVDPLNEANLAIPASSDSSKALRKDLEIRKVQQEVTQYWAKYERANLLPAISLQARVSDVVQEYNSFSDAEFSGLVSPDYFNYSVGLQLQWTLFDGFATTSKAKQKLSEAKIAQREWQKLEKEVKLSQTEADEQLHATKTMVEAAKMARDAAATTFEQGEKDFQKGMFNLNQLLELESELKNSELNWANAQASRLMAKANYFISHGISLVEGNP